MNINNITKHTSNNFYILLGFAFITFLFFIPRLILGDLSYLKPHDFLDSELVYRVLVANYNTPTIEQVMNGIPRNFLPSNKNLIVWLMMTMDEFKAISINEFLIRFIAFIGMFLLLTEHFELKKNNLAAFLTSISFSTLPYYHIYGITIAGQPIILWCILNIYNNRKIYLSLFLISLFPLYSSFVLSGIFIVAILWVFSIITIIRKKNRKLIIASLILTSMYLFVEWDLINSIISSEKITNHRTDWDIEYLFNKDFMGSYSLSKEHFFHGQYHAHSKHFYILILSIITLPIAFINKDKSRISIPLIILSCLALSFIHGFWRWEGLNHIKGAFPVLKTFNASRVSFLSPTLWFILAGITLNTLSKLPFKIATSLIMLTMFTFQMKHQLTKSELGINAKKSIAKVVFNKDVGVSGNSYKSYFNKDLFNEIKNFINRDQSKYRVVSIGISPSIAQLNGFYTLDSYQNIYPLSYKRDFREIIEHELEMNPRMKEYFDKWGSRCYIFNRPAVENTIEALINTSKLKNMGGEYIFSRYIIRNSNDINIKLIKTFENNFGVIYLYEVI